MLPFLTQQCTSHQYLTNVQSWNRLFGGETIHPTQKFTWMNLLQMPCVITWAWKFLTSEVLEAVRGQKHHIFKHTFGSVHRIAPVLLTKDQEMWSVMPLSLHSSSIFRILEPSLQGLISSTYINFKPVWDHIKTERLNAVFRVFSTSPESNIMQVS